MTSPLWQRTDGELLKALREQAGLDRSVLARMGTMTPQQLRGLEEGEGGEFYSPEIKAHLGRTLLAKLGYVAPVAPADTAPDLAAPADHSPPAAPERLSIPLPDPPPRPMLAAAARPAPVASRHARGGRLAAITVGLVVVVLGTWALLGPIRSRPVAPPVATAADVSPPTAAAPAQVAASSAATVVTSAVMPSVTPATPAPAPAPVAAADAACPADTGAPAVAYTPSEPRKAGNFVYLVADRPARLCVMDATRKATRLDLEAGAGRSVYGPAPFVVQGDLGHLRIFFQGVRVQGEIGAGTRVVLNEAPVR